MSAKTHSLEPGSGSTIPNIDPGKGELRGRAGSVPGCKVCAVLSSQPLGGWVARANGWAACVFPGHEVPGSLVGCLEDHIEGLWGLPEPQADTLGPFARKLAGALRTVTGARKVYLVAIGESCPHFHFLVAAPPIGLPQDESGFAYLTATATLRDRTEAARVANAVREELNA